MKTYAIIFLSTLLLSGSSLCYAQTESPAMRVQDARESAQTQLHDANPAHVNKRRHQRKLAKKINSAGIQSWLKSTGMDEYVKLSGMYSRVSRSYSENVDQFFEGFDARHINDSNVDPSNRRYVVEFTPVVSSDDYKLFLQDYRNKFSANFHDKLVNKVLLYSGLNRDRIIVSTRSGCSTFTLVPLRTGDIRDVGLKCSMVVRGAPVRVTPIANFDGTSDNEDSIPVRIAADFREAVPAFLGTILGEEFDTDYQVKEDGFVHVNIKGGKGLVIRNGRDWEKVQLMFVKFTSEDALFVNLIADGLISSGAGDYPPDNQFTDGFEPDHVTSLTEFTNRTAIAFGEFLGAQTGEIDTLPSEGDAIESVGDDAESAAAAAAEAIGILQDPEND